MSTSLAKLDSVVSPRPTQITFNPACLAPVAIRKGNLPPPAIKPSTSRAASFVSFISLKGMSCLEFNTLLISVVFDIMYLIFVSHFPCLVGFSMVSS
jgi:hypothetical protein